MLKEILCSSSWEYTFTCKYSMNTGDDSDKKIIWVILLCNLEKGRKDDAGLQVVNDSICPEGDIYPDNHKDHLCDFSHLFPHRMLIFLQKVEFV